MHQRLGNDLILGRLPGRNASLAFPRSGRDKHLYICGGTGTGKSKFLESLIRQDILAWRKSKCGLIVLDPHGSLYDSLIQWLAWNKNHLERPIVPIDLRQDDWVISYNLLRQRRLADPAVLVDNIVDAMAYVWGQSGTDQTPRFARWAGTILRTLYDNNLTLIESEHLIDHLSRQMRYLLTGKLTDKASKQDLLFANTLNPRDFESQVGSTVNRLQRFVRTQTMRSMFGLPGVSLDLGKALDEGSIILVSLATEGGKVSKENSELFATLLLSDLWTAAQERGKRQGIKPFYVYLDEFQRFVTPTIAENLDEARGYGLHLTMAHQFPNQLLDRGESGKRVYNSIMENASSKVVFRLTHEENLRVMAQSLFMGVMDPDEIKHQLYSTKVMAYKEEMRTSYTKASSTGGGDFSGTTETASESGSTGDLEEMLRWAKAAALSGGDSSTWTDSESETTSSVLMPVLGKELSHVQFRSLEEQLFRSMAVLFDQKQRQGVARLVGMSAPVSLYTPEVRQFPGSAERTKSYISSLCSKLPFALPSAKAKIEIEHRAKELPGEILKAFSDEAATAKRKISK